MQTVENRGGTPSATHTYYTKALLTAPGLSLNFGWLGLFNGTCGKKGLIVQEEGNMTITHIIGFGRYLYPGISRNPMIKG